MRSICAPALGLLLTLLSSVAGAQDVVILRNGNEFEGRIIEDREDTLVVLVSEPVGRVALEYANLYSVNGIAADRILGVRAEIREFLARSQRMRGLTPVGSFSRQFANPKAMAVNLRQAWEAHTSMPDQESEQRVFVKLQLMPSFLSLAELRRDAFSDPQPAYFEPQGRVLHLSVALSARPAVADRSEKAVTRAVYSAPLERSLLFHEIQHLLQTHNYGAEGQILDPASGGDARLALLCLQEGDADLAMLDFVAESEGVDPALLTGVFDVLQTVPHATLERLRGLPTYLATLHGAPHEAGLAFARRLRQVGGWALLGKAYGDPPTTTEQILHPEKYLVARETPLVFGEAVLAEELPGSALIWSDTLGELRIQALFRHWLEDDEKAAAAAAGWDGDRMFALSRGETNQVVVGWHTAWDEEKDAREFFEAMKAAAQKRYPGRVQSAAESTPTLALLDVSTEDGVWQEQHAIEIREKSVVVLETSHVPSAEALRAALWNAVATRPVSEQRVQAGAGEMRPLEVPAAARAFWTGAPLQTTATGLAVADGFASVTGTGVRFAVQAAWAGRPDGALAANLPGSAAVITAETFSLPMALPSTLVGMWSEGRGPAPGSVRATRRLLKSYSGWTVPAGPVRAYVAAESATDAELKTLARIYRVYVARESSGVLLEIKLPESHVDGFAEELDRVLGSIRLE